MIEELQVEARHVALADWRAAEMGRLRGSITGGKGSIHGFLGEVLIAERIGAQIENTFDYDLIKGAIRIDVKTKRCTSRPHDDYECSIAAFNTRQKCDFYVFVRILEDFSRAWLLGAIRKEDYFREARFCREGDIDPGSGHGWRFKADCYNLPIKKLRRLQSHGMGQRQPA